MTRALPATKPMRQWSLAIAVVISFAAAQADAQVQLTPQPNSAPEIAPRKSRSQPAATSSYCQAGSGGFLMSEAKGYAAIGACSRGDTIIIPGGSTSVIARVCDFSKSIVQVSDNIVCVMVVPERGKR